MLALKKGEAFVRSGQTEQAQADGAQPPAMARSQSTQAAYEARIDALFECTILGWSKPDAEGDPNIVAIHRFFALVVRDGKAQIVKLTVKETGIHNDPNPLYTVESVKLNEKSPAAQWVAAASSANGVDLISIRSAGDVSILAQQIESFNSTPSAVRCTTAANGISTTDAKSLYHEITQGMENAPPVSIVREAAQLPFDAPADAKGVYHGGVVYLVSGNLEGVVDGRNTIVHEVIGHYGLRGFFGKGLGAVLVRIHGSNVSVQKAAYKWKRDNADVIARWKSDL